MTDTPGGPHRIDVHAHYLAPAYKQALQEAGGNMDEAEKILRTLSPVEMESVPLGLEDAFISYFGERGEKTFILSEMEAQP